MPDHVYSVEYTAQPARWDTIAAVDCDAVPLLRSVQLQKQILLTHCDAICSETVPYTDQWVL